MKKQTHQSRFYRKKIFLWTAGIGVGVVSAILIGSRVSPWPGAMVIRYVFERDGVKMSQALEKHQPAVAVASITEQQYRAGDKDALLDVYFPHDVAGTSKRLPLVIWTHGGAWISGDKDDHAAYYKLLAAEGFAVISAGYSLGPEKTYPTAIHQLNDMYAYVQANANRFYVDTDQIVLAGDSAGAQLSSQMAALITNHVYAQEMQITPNLTAAQLKGVVLNCGIYKMEELIHPDPTLPKIIGWGDDVSVWAYLGSRDFTTAYALSQMSTYYHADGHFPPTYISGGNGDPLTNVQSKPFSDRLESMGVKVTKLFYADNHTPALPHEYQFNLDNQDGKHAFDATIAYLKSITE